jgi:hypothetical protein
MKGRELDFYCFPLEGKGGSEEEATGSRKNSCLKT